ncbi:hypothetical protein KW807_01225 [Candidatus Parcubacteria bacterium]|nr:hypothetical protein [Candidatus Parcubacteria bacterium]
MKKVLILIIIIAGVGFIYWHKNPQTSTNPTSTTGSTTKPNPESATISFDDESVTLSNGKDTNSDGEETEILPQQDYGDLNNDGKDDTVFLVARSGGGSGVFIYAAAYVSGPINYKGSNAVFLGDRIAPKSIGVSNGVATITYLDRREDEPFAAEPTISRTIKLVYENGELVEK